MKKQNKKPVKKSAPAKKPQSVSVVIKAYPHVIHVHRNGEECPAERVLPANADSIEVLRTKLAAVPGNVVSVEMLDQHGRPA